jgi:hypothetical protein
MVAVVVALPPYLAPDVRTELLQRVRAAYAADVVQPAEALAGRVQDDLVRRRPLCIQQGIWMKTGNASSPYLLPTSGIHRTLWSPCVNAE